MSSYFFQYLFSMYRNKGVKSPEYCFSRSHMDSVERRQERRALFEQRKI